MVMPSGGRWSGDASRQSRRLAILHGAGQVFAEAGYDRAGMDAIALAAGVSKVTVYAHFRDKAGLYEAVMEHWLDELPAPVLAPRADAGLREQLSEVVRELQRQAAHPAALAIARTLARSAQAPPLEHSERWRQRHEPYQRHLEKLLARHCGCDDPALAARQFLMLVGGGLEPSAAVPGEEAMAALEVFLRAYPERRAR